MILVFNLQKIRLVIVYILIFGYAVLLLDHSSSVHLRLRGATRKAWPCKTKNDEGATAHTPLVVFALPRTGSTLLFSMMENINDATNVKELDLLSLREIFNPYHNKVKEWGVSSTSMAMKQACGLPKALRRGKGDWEAWVKGNTTTYMEVVRTGIQDGWPLEVIEKFDRRLNDPEGLLSFVAQVPSWSKNSIFAIKVFAKQLERMSLSPQNFVDYLAELGKKRTKFVVIWRRRAIESFVSQEIALATGKWAGNKTAEDNAIFVKKDTLEEYIEGERRYYRAVRDALIASGVDYEVFEYHKDLRDVSQQLKTIERLTSVLGLSSQSINVTSVHEKLDLVKQAQVPLEEQVKNWQEVVEWGYGGDVEEWINLFDQRLSSISFHTLLLFVYLIPVFVQFIYTQARATNLFRSTLKTRFFTDDPQKDAGNIPDGEEPSVTVQICTYNEGPIVEETIKCACSVDWPKDKLFIDVCDDSTDPDSIAIIKQVVAHWGPQVNITHRRRPDRVGYKAGNLQYHFPSLRGDFVAVFDADHRMERDFLRRAMPYFYDKEGNTQLRIGMVQAPWAHYNTHQNLLTESDTLALDAHHAIEQTGRSTALSMFGFNGTGGVWRKSAIADAGGWSYETVTEDLALSYKAYMKGYHFVYVRHIPQQLESPSCILAHVQQRHRWTKGFLQVFRLSFLDILFSPKASLAVKWEAFVHMTAPIQYFCVFVLTAFYPLLVLHEIDSDLIRLVSVLPQIAPVLEALAAVYVKESGSDEHYHGICSRTSRLMFILPHFALKNGMMLFETRAVFEGLTSNDATFLTTPKEGSPTSKTKGVASRSSANKARHGWKEAAIAWFGIVFAFYRLGFVFYYDLTYEIKHVFHVWFHIVNLSVCFGLFWVNGAFLLKKSQHNLDKMVGRRQKSANTLRLQLRSLCQGFAWYLTANEACFFEERVKLKDLSARSQRTVKTTQLRMRTVLLGLGYSAAIICYLLGKHVSTMHRGGVVSSANRWSCPIRNSTEATDHTPLVVFALPRTGSNLLFNMMKQIDFLVDDSELEVLRLNEVFSTDASLEKVGISHTSRAMTKACDVDPAASNGHWTKEVIAMFGQRFRNPKAMLHFLAHIPSWSRRAFFTIKVFSFHLNDVSFTPQTFVDSIVSISQKQTPKLIVLWRRRAIESFVSHAIATKTDAWFESKTGEGNAIVVNKRELEKYIEDERRYYRAVRDALVASGVGFEVFEYDRDLRDQSQQLGTLKRLVRMLGLSDEDVDLKKAQQKIDLVKQAQVPLEKQVKNWQDVVDWGYGGEVNEWVNLFDQLSS